MEAQEQNHLSPYDRVLKAGHIRLVNLEAGDWQSSIRCELIHHDLSSSSAYTALSYAWGAPKATQSIIVNDENFNVTVNLESALRHLKQRSASQLLWVDALCINQRDDLERTHQVLMMREIYASASDVIIFLGDGLEHRTERVGAYPEPAKQVIFKCDDTDDEIVRDILGKWTKRRSSTPRITVREIFCLIRMVASKEYIELLESIPMEYSERLFEGLRMLLLTPWWSRVWVLQEAIVSVNLIVHCGGVTCTWDMFATAARGFKTSRPTKLGNDFWKVFDYFSRLVLDIDHRRGMWLTKNVRTQQQAARVGSSYQPYRPRTPTDQSPIHLASELLALLRATRTRRALDDRDKVFALVGLIPEHELLEPNYSLTCQDLYTNATRYIIHTSGCLDILCGDIGRKNRSDLPSWVLDWSAAVASTDTDKLRLLALSEYCATNKSKVIHNVAIKDSWLDLGKQIRKYIGEQTSSRSKAIPLPPWGRPVLEFLDNHRDDYKSNHYIFDVLFDILEHSDPLCCVLGYRDTKATLPRVPHFAIYEAPGRLSMEAVSIGMIDEVCIPSDKSLNVDNWVGSFLYIKSKTQKKEISILSDSLLLYLINTAKGEILPQEILMRDLDIIKILCFDMKFQDGQIKRLRIQDFVPFEPSTPGVLRKPTYPWPVASETSIFSDLGFGTIIEQLGARQRLFSTQDGDCGWCPIDAQVGDEIYLLPGGRVPFVMRRKLSDRDGRLQFQLIGDCFLHGAMYGEKLSKPSIHELDLGLPLFFWKECSRLLSLQLTDIGIQFVRQSVEMWPNQDYLLYKVDKYQESMSPFVPFSKPSSEYDEWLSNLVEGVGLDFSFYLHGGDGNDDWVTTRITMVKNLGPLLSAYDMLHLYLIHSEIILV